MFFRTGSIKLLSVVLISADPALNNFHMLKFLFLFWDAGFPTAVENMGGGGGGGSSKFDGEGLSQYIWGAWGWLKMLLKNTCE